MDIPISLSNTSIFNANTALPQNTGIEVNLNVPTYVYNYYSLDPDWHKHEEGNRILILDPEIFKQYPVSDRCIDFVMALSQNIPNIQVFTGSFQDLHTLCCKSPIHFKEHPLNKHYRGIQEPRDWIAPRVDGYFPSFFGYWKQVEKNLV
jgi:deoxyribodipyrimidine photo-lyase